MLGKKTSNRGRNPLVWLAPEKEQRESGNKRGRWKVICLRQVSEDGYENVTCVGNVQRRRSSSTWPRWFDRVDEEQDHSREAFSM